MNTILITLPFLLLTAPLCAADIVLARFDLAGMPVAADLPPGLELELIPEFEEQSPMAWRVAWGDQTLGYIPARFSLSLEMLFREGRRPRIVIAAWHDDPSPGRFLQVELRCRTHRPQELLTWHDPLEEAPKRSQACPETARMD